MAERTNMETMLNTENQSEAAEVMDFLGTLDQNEKKEFLTFLQAAKFVKSLTAAGEMKTA